MNDPFVEDVLAQLREAVAGGGVHAGLALLNQRTLKRFTGVYRFDPPMLRNLHLFDRENPAMDDGADAPLAETYCSIVGETGAGFTTENTREDARVASHPARDNVISYCGALLRASDGTPFGTLCNFDLIPRPVTVSEQQLLHGAAAVIMAAVEAEAYGEGIGTRD